MVLVFPMFGRQGGFVQLRILYLEVVGIRRPTSSQVSFLNFLQIENNSELMTTSTGPGHLY